MRNSKHSNMNPRTARELIDDIQRFVDNAPVGNKSDDFMAFEADLSELVNGFKRELLRAKIQSLDPDSDVVLIDGKAHRKALDSETTITTTAGPVIVQHRLYRDRSVADGRTVSALEKRLGIVEGFTPQAAKLAHFLVTELVPEKAAETFERFGGMTPSKSTLDRLPKALSERWEADRESYEGALREVMVIPEGTASLVVSLDGVLAPLEGTAAPAKRRETARQGRLTKGPTGYREVGCGTLSFCDKNGDMISAVRIARAPEHKKASLKKALVEEVAAVLKRSPNLQLVKIADGAKDNWEFLSADLPSGLEVLDFFHAAEHLNAALGAYYGDGSVDARHRFEKLRETLRDDEDGVASVIRALQRLAKTSDANAIRTCIAYFKANKSRMRYAQMREQGIPIGSGVVEAACKTLVTQRLKRSGMYWGVEGAQAILTPRAWTQSDRFDHAWALLGAQYTAQVDIVRRLDVAMEPHGNVIPFRPKASG